MSLTEAEQAERAHIEWWCQEWDGHIGTHGQAKVDEIRRLVADGAQQRPVAAMFGIAQSHVGRIVRREVWR
jgi:hypothetical protein